MIIKLNDAYMYIVFWQGFECPNEVILDPRDLRWDREWVDYDLWWSCHGGVASRDIYYRLTGCQSVVDFLLFVPFCRQLTLSGHRLIWDLVEAISDLMRWLCAKLTYEWPIDGSCEKWNECCRWSVYACIVSTCVYLLVLYLAIN